MEKFSYAEIELIEDSLSALLQKKSSDILMRGILGSVLSRDPDEKKRELEDLKKELIHKLPEEKKIEEDITILRAKLIQMKRELQDEQIRNLATPNQ